MITRLAYLLVPAAIIVASMLFVFAYYDDQTFPTDPVRNERIFDMLRNLAVSEKFLETYPDATERTEVREESTGETYYLLGLEYIDDNHSSLLLDIAFNTDQYTLFYTVLCHSNVDRLATAALINTDALEYLIAGDCMGGGTGAPARFETFVNTFDNSFIGISQVRTLEYFDSPYSSFGYEATIDNSSYALDGSSGMISGDGFGVLVSIHERIDISEVRDYDDLHLAFDYRAMSDSSTLDTTNAYLRINDAVGRHLYEEQLVEGGTTDTKWTRYERNIIDDVKRLDRIEIEIGFKDIWLDNHDQTFILEQSLCQIRLKSIRTSKNSKGRQPSIVKRLWPGPISS